MGVIKRGILGGFSGRVANVVGSAWKGIAYMKSLPLSVANPRTTPQVNQRNKFRGASELASSILGQWIKPLWDRFAQGMSGYNDWMKVNTEFFDNTGVPVWDSLLMSKGKMMPPTITTVAPDVSDNSITIAFAVPDDLTWGQANESAYAVCVIKETGKVYSEIFTVSPGDTPTLAVPATDLVAGQNVACYMAIKRADGTQVSPSAYSTAVVVA